MIYMYFISVGIELKYIITNMHLSLSHFCLTTLNSIIFQKCVRDLHVLSCKFPKHAEEHHGDRHEVIGDK